MEELIRRAKDARSVAYAPYSGYQVGAAVADASGRIWSGVNVENVSFGATICAERSAIVQMVSEGVRELASIAVATKDGSAPCGMCLQVLAEFAPDPRTVQVALVGETGPPVIRPLHDFLPFGFHSDEVSRT